jgi:hypothetical protein
VNWRFSNVIWDRVKPSLNLMYPQLQLTVQTTIAESPILILRVLRMKPFLDMINDMYGLPVWRTYLLRKPLKTWDFAPEINSECIVFINLNLLKNPKLHVQGHRQSTRSTEWWFVDFMYHETISQTQTHLGIFTMKRPAEEWVSTYFTNCEIWILY